MTSSIDTITIPTWANGPDDSGNGGWSAGLLAEQLGADALASGVAVSLRVPPPVGRDLRVARTDRGLDLFDDAGDEPVLVATAEPAAVSLDAPAQVRSISSDQARGASAGFPFRDHHPFPHCVSCGIEREAGQVALRLHCGPVDGVAVGDAPVFADVWTPEPNVPHDASMQQVEVAATWSALDCPSAAPVADPDAPNPIVLARIAARVEESPRVGEPVVLASWHVSSDGRKHVTRSVMVASGERVLAAADALWIEVRPR